MQHYLRNEPGVYYDDLYHLVRGHLLSHRPWLTRSRAGGCTPEIFIPIVGGGDGDYEHFGPLAPPERGRQDPSTSKQAPGPG